MAQLNKFLFSRKQIFFFYTVLMFSTFFNFSLFAQNISTIAGTGSASFSGDGGLATSATLNLPYAVATDGAGNIFIADRNNHRIRKIDLNGTITTIGGNNTPGFSGDGGNATSASLLYPYDLAVDATGNIYVADWGNHRIRKISTSGIITTVAGNGSPAFSGDGGNAVSASLNNPTGLCVDTSGNIFIADYNNNRIRKVNKNGIITTVAGTGTIGFSGDGGLATSATFRNPYGVSVDKKGNLYIADFSNHRVRKVDTLNIITTIAGTGINTFSGDGNLATSATLNGPTKLLIDNYSNIFIADYNNRIRKIASNGIISTIAGTGVASFSGDGGLATSATINSHRGVALDGAGNLYIADVNNNRIRKVTNVSPPDNSINLTSGLVAYYPFNGNIGDSSGYSNHPAFNNAALTSDRFGNNNKAYAFNGTNNYMRIPTSSSLNTGNQISISVWVKPTGFHYGSCFGNNILIKGYGGSGDALTGNYLLRFDDAYYRNYNNCAYSLPDSLHQNFHAYDVKSSSYLTKNTWYYLTYTCDGTKSRFYVNGVPVDSAAANNILFTNTSDLYFGYSNNPTNPFWLNGALDDIRIYNRAISPSEITALYNENVVLPVTLLSFTGVRQSQTIDLQWTTANETNTASFIVQRSNDGINFTNIGTVTAIGNSSKRVDYAFTDFQPNSSKSYYRLKIVDKDGSFTVSNVLAFSFDLNNTSSITIQLSPNPAKSYAQLQIASIKNSDALINVIDLSGKILLTQKTGIKAGTNVFNINNISILKSGLYLVQINIDGAISTKKLLIAE